MLRFLIVLSAVCIFFVGCQVTWTTRGRVQNPEQFYSKAIQEMIYDVEKLGFSNLRLTDYVIPLNERLYNWQVVGNATYTDGFVVSIQKIDVSNIVQSVGSRIVNNETLVTASVTGMLNLRDVTVGFNVEANIEDEGIFKYTGTFNHILVQLRVLITKNLITDDITVDASTSSLSAGSGIRMIYMPSSNITEVLSRRYVPSNNWDGTTNWARNVFAPTLVQVVKERVPFPMVCFSDC